MISQLLVAYAMYLLKLYTVDYFVKKYYYLIIVKDNIKTHSDKKKYLRLNMFISN